MKLALSLLITGVLPFTVAAQSSSATGQSDSKSQTSRKKKSSARSSSGKASNKSQTPAPAKEPDVIPLNPDNPNDPRAPMVQPAPSTGKPPADRVAPPPAKKSGAKGANTPGGSPKP
jgi:hypothetical protein